MDRVIEKKKGIRAVFRKKNIPYFLAGVFVIFVLWLLLRDKSSTLKVDANTVTIGDVRLGEFDDYVRVSGQVQPITVVQVSLLEGGVVEEKLIEEGSMVKKGDVLVRLSNNTLGLQILQSEADLAEQENFLRNTTVTMEQEKLDLEKQRLEYTIDTERKRRKYEQYRRLDEDGLVAHEEYLQAKEDYELAVKSLELVIARQKQDSIYRSIQIGNLEESLESMRRSIQLVRQRVENLNVKSPIDGQLGSLDVILGQSIPEGTKIGQVNDLSDYKIEARIDEHYIDRVQSGLSATFERQGANFSTVVEKVYPEVTEGQFKADFYFEGERPDNIRIGQTYYLNLQLGQPTQSAPGSTCSPRTAPAPTAATSASAARTPSTTKCLKACSPASASSSTSASAARTPSTTKCLKVCSPASASSSPTTRTTARATCSSSRTRNNLIKTH